MIGGGGGKMEEEFPLTPTTAVGWLHNVNSLAGNFRLFVVLAKSLNKTRTSQKLTHKIQ